MGADGWMDIQVCLLETSVDTEGCGRASARVSNRFIFRYAEDLF